MMRAALFVLWFVCASVSSRLAAEDTVTVTSASNPSVQTKRRGIILDFFGTELKLRTMLGAEETIPAARIVEVQTTWTPPHETARAARSAGRFDDAIAAFRQAKSAEARPWAVRQISAEQSGCYLDASRIEPAVNEFLAILAADPQTRHFEAIPVAWRAAPDNPALKVRAESWLELRRAPAVSLVGASWLLESTHHAAAVKALDELQAADDPRISGLATIQLWRTKLAAASLDDARRWQSQLERMPTPIQPTGWFVLGELYARLDQPQLAALAYLKIPLLHRALRALAADALLAAGGQLEKMAQPKEAAGLYRELTRDYPGLAATTEAQQRLTTLREAGF
jgi:tetratricopeptide (TPR) repeat protein